MRKKILSIALLAGAAIGIGGGAAHIAHRHHHHRDRMMRHVARTCVQAARDLDRHGPPPHRGYDYDDRGPGYDAPLRAYDDGPRWRDRAERRWRDGGERRWRDDGPRWRDRAERRWRDDGPPRRAERRHHRARYDERPAATPEPAFDAPAPLLDTPAPPAATVAPEAE